MTTDTTPTRRSFLKGSALLAVPLAAAIPAAVAADDGLKARLAKLEDEAAIHKLHQAWLRWINTREDDDTGAADTATSLFADAVATASDQTLRGITADHAGQPDVITVAADGHSANGQFHSAVETVTPIAQDCTLGQMAHAQGSGFVRQTERRVLKVEYAKASGAWSIAKVEFQNGS